MKRDIHTALAYDQTTLEFYDKEAPIYAASGTDSASRWLYDFIQLLPPGARILDLGCGGGRDTQTLLAQGFTVDAADGSSAMARQAEERLGQPIKVMRFDELAAIDGYDGIWANASLLHVPRAALGDVLARVLRALKPGGFHFASYKAGDAAGRDALGRYFNYLDRTTLLDAYKKSGPWQILSAKDHAGDSYDGAPTPWIAVTVQKPALI